MKVQNNKMGEKKEERKGKNEEEDEDSKDKDHSLFSLDFIV